MSHEPEKDDQSQVNLTTSLTASQVIVDELTELITSNKLQTGAIVTEVGIAEQFGTSRTPAREALKALVQTGLIKHKDRRYTVNEINLARISELYRIRGALEELLVQELASNVSVQKMVEVENALILGSGKDQGIVSHFHEHLLQICGNCELRQLLENVYKRLAAYRILDGKCRSGEVDGDHRRLIRLLIEGNVEAARHLMRDHIGKSHQAIVDLSQRGITRITFDRTTG
ncbi:MAG: GntR family transcriptional regulator [Parvibaculaceae bacterium]